MFRMFRFLLWAGLVACLMLAIGGGGRWTPRPATAPRVASAALLATLEEIGELQTLRVGIQGIVSAEEKSPWIWQGDSKVVLLVKGYATYGLDLDRASVALNAHEIVVTLPTPRITNCWVDVVESTIWDRQEGFLHDPGPALDARAYAEALALVRREANQEQIARKAQMRAEEIIRGLADRPVRVIWI
ncbi:MAG: DUF4230 domain-containing protein [Phycisphaerales bacterium]|nr:DUF4230 domain-containing protein [Phycisphaerales bacterium]